MSDEEFEAVLAAERPRVRAHLLGSIRNPADADDLTQDVLVRAWRARAELRDPRAVRSWLYRIAANVAAERARSEARRAARETAAARQHPADAGCSDDVALGVDQAEMSSCVRSLTGQLTDAQRAAVVLHDGLGLSNPEVARVLDCSLPAAKIRLHRGRAQLASLVDETCQTHYDERGVLVCEPRDPV